jgi:hypothetical protein
MKPWLLVQPEDLDMEYHVIPLGDLIEHVPTLCVCGPICEPQLDDEGAVRSFLYIHHSLDNREADEANQGYVTRRWIMQSLTFLTTALTQPGSPRERGREFMKVCRALKRKGIPRAGKLELDSEKEGKS